MGKKRGAAYGDAEAAAGGGADAERGRRRAALCRRAERKGAAIGVAETAAGGRADAEEERCQAARCRQAKSERGRNRGVQLGRAVAVEARGRLSLVPHVARWRKREVASGPSEALPSLVPPPITR